MLEVKSLNFAYRCGRQILEDVSFSVPSGACLAVLGNNGAGKSTLLGCLARLLRPQRGRALVDGEDLLAMSAAQAARTVALVSQFAPASRLTVYDMVLLGRRPYLKWDFTAADRALTEEALERLGLEGLALRYADQLSGGEGQKVQLARALVQQPRLLLLDEPTSSLDLRSQYEVLGLVSQLCREKRLTAVVVLHDLNLALRFCGRFLLLHGGRVYTQGDPSVVTPRAIRDVYGMEAEVRELDGVPVVIPSFSAGGAG